MSCLNQAAPGVPQSLRRLRERSFVVSCLMHVPQAAFLHAGQKSGQGHFPLILNATVRFRRLNSIQIIIPDFSLIKIDYHIFSCRKVFHFTPPPSFAQKSSIFSDIRTDQHHSTAADKHPVGQNCTQSGPSYSLHILHGAFNKIGLEAGPLTTSSSSSSADGSSSELPPSLWTSTPSGLPIIRSFSVFNIGTQ